MVADAWPGARHRHRQARLAPDDRPARRDLRDRGDGDRQVARACRQNRQRRRQADRRRPKRPALRRRAKGRRRHRGAARRGRRQGQSRRGGGRRIEGQAQDHRRRPGHDIARKARLRAQLAARAGQRKDRRGQGALRTAAQGLRRRGRPSRAGRAVEPDRFVARRLRAPVAPGGRPSERAGAAPSRHRQPARPARRHAPPNRRRAGAPDRRRAGGLPRRGAERGGAGALAKGDAVGERRPRPADGQAQRVGSGGQGAGLRLRAAAGPPKGAGGNQEPRARRPANRLAGRAADQNLAGDKHARAALPCGRAARRTRVGAGAGTVASDPAHAQASRKGRWRRSRGLGARPRAAAAGARARGGLARRRAMAGGSRRVDRPTSSRRRWRAGFGVFRRARRGPLDHRGGARVRLGRGRRAGVADRGRRAGRAGPRLRPRRRAGARRGFAAGHPRRRRRLLALALWQRA